MAIISLETDAPAEDAYHLMMWLILEKPAVKMKLGALELTPRAWDNYEYRSA